MLICAAFLLGATQTIADEASSARALYDRASSQLAQNNLDAARNTLEQLVRHHNGSPITEIAVTRLMECQLASGISSDTIAAIALGRTWLARLETSDAAERLLPGSRQHCRQLLVRALKHRALELEKAAYFAAALELLTDAIELAAQPDREEIHAERLRIATSSFVHAAQHEADDAHREQSDESLAAIFDNDEVVAIRLAAAEILVDQKLDAEAEPHLRWLSNYVTAQEVKPEWAQTVALRQAELEFRAKRYGQASQIATDAIARTADKEQSVELEFLLVRSAIATIKFDDARARLEGLLTSLRSREHTPENSVDHHAQAAWMLGELHFLQRKFQPAIEAYREAEKTESPTWLPASLVQRAKCHELLRDPGLAHQCYRRLIEEFPTSSAAATARVRLVSLPEAALPKR